MSNIGDVMSLYKFIHGEAPAERRSAIANKKFVKNRIKQIKKQANETKVYERKVKAIFIIPLLLLMTYLIYELCQRI